ncbi:type I restriction/modification system, specificity subunit [Campylobacter lari]|uniref:restriction endonuclease subunit S n=1 Tax=Campylobacter lari TaxID=201 RepID=UPI002152ABE8|nr:restriction endonuclease subunit S [Campylobacter lari]MCR6529822.1 restriction endonuclease subunit S [Campylobacter lari]
MKNFKDSGIEWLGEIPEHWEVVKIKFLAIFYTGDSIKDSEKHKYCFLNNSIPYISTKDIDINTNVIDYNNGMFIEKNDANFKRAYKNSILLCLEGANAGKKIAFLYKEVCFVNKLCCISSKTEKLNSKFLFYFLQSVFFKNAFIANIRGLIGGITTDQLGNFYILFPPLKEQEQIANFLDEKCEKIKNFIEKKEKLISLLKEQKQALINETITKGLNKNVNFKDSGIEWLGEIPEHWEVVRLGLILKTGSGTTPDSGNDKYYKEGKIAWINSGDLNDGFLKDSKRKITQDALYDYPTLRIFDKNSLIIAMYGATIGKTAILKINACVNQACCVLEKSLWYNNFYLFFWFNGYKKELISMGSGGGQPNISQDIIKNLKIPLPPLKEQEQIANFLDEKCEKIDLLIEKTEKQIKLIKEYKTTLINQAVCGRIDL